MSSKKKNLIVLCVLSVVLIGCLLLYFWMPSRNSDGEGGDSGQKSDEIVVDTISTESIAQISFQKEGTEVWSVNHKKDIWKFTNDASIPVNDEKMSKITEALNPVTATTKLEESNLKDYGLEAPSMMLTITATDGREYQYKIGMKVPKENMGYYALSNAGNTIYCLNEALIDAVNVEQIQMIKMDTLPGIETDYMTYINVHNAKGKDFEAKRVSDKEKVDFYSNWNITKPYEKPLATSATNWSKTLGFFNGLTYTELVEYKANTLEKYGLKSPSSVITVKYYEAKEGYTPTATATPSTLVTGNSSGQSSYLIPKDKREYKTLILCIGKKTKTGYYVCEKGSTTVYKMNSDVVENMTKLDAYESMDHCVYSVLATSIDGYDVTYGDTKLHITRTPEKNTDSAEKPDSNQKGTAVENTSDKNVKNIWKLNGKRISEDDENDFLTPYSTAYLLEFSSVADKKKKSEKPVLTIVYHEKQRDVTVKYLPYDGVNFYRVDKNGMDYFLVDKLLVDDIIEKFKEIEKLG